MSRSRKRNYEVICRLNVYKLGLMSSAGIAEMCAAMHRVVNEIERSPDNYNAKRFRSTFWYPKDMMKREQKPTRKGKVTNA